MSRVAGRQTAVKIVLSQVVKHVGKSIYFTMSRVGTVSELNSLFIEDYYH